MSVPTANARRTTNAWALAILAAPSCGVIAGLGDPPVLATDATPTDGAIDGTSDDAAGDLDAHGELDVTVLGDGGDASDAPDGDAALGDATLALVPGCELGGLQAGSPSPMAHYCPSDRNRSPLAGPASEPKFRWAVKIDGFVTSAPTIGADGTIYVASFDGVVSALSPADGHTLWTHGSDAGPTLSVSPLVAADSTLRVLSASPGAYVILALDGGVLGNVPVTETRGAIAIAGDGDLFVVTSTGKMLDLNAGGSQLWSTSGTTDDFSPVVFAAGTRVFTADHQQAVSALERGDGAVAWSSPLAGPAGTSDIPALALALDGTLRAVVAGTADAGVTVYSLAASDGGVLWSHAVGSFGDGRYGVALADDGTTYVASQTGLYAVAPDGGAGTSNLIARPSGIILDSHGDVFAVTSDSRFAAYHGDTLGQTFLVGIPDSGSLYPQDTPVIAPNQRVYVLLSDRSTTSLLAAFDPGP